MNDQMLLLSFDRFCAGPERVVGAILEGLGVPGVALEDKAYQNGRSAPAGASPEVLGRALYDRLLIHEMPLGY